MVVMQALWLLIMIRPGVAREQVKIGGGEEVKILRARTWAGIPMGILISKNQDKTCVGNSNSDT